MSAKKVFLVHGWCGTPEADWFPWLKRELERKGFEVIAPEMPDTDYPKIAPWVKTLKEAVGKIDENTYFVGHSIGCQTILRFLEKSTSDSRAGGVVFVAGWLKLIDAPDVTEGDRKTAELWERTPIDFVKAKSHVGKFVAIFSDNDPYVSVDEGKIFKEKLNAKIIVEHGKGHFRKEDGFEELPVVLQELLKVAK